MVLGFGGFGGYQHAPVIQCLSLATLTLTTALQSTNIALDVFQVYRGEVWRFLTSTLIFSDSSEAVVGLILLYTCRQFERQMGTKKFAAFLFFSFAVSSLISLAFITTAATVGIYFVPAPGPYYIIFALLTFYYWHIPKLYSTNVFILGMEVSEKSWIYLLACQLLLSNGLSSVVAAVAGIVAGYIYEVDGYGIQRFRLPSRVEYVFGLFGRLLGAFHGNSSSGNNTQPNVPRANDTLTNGRRSGATATAAAAAPEPPSEEAIEALMGMGFDREAVVRALRASGNSVEAAANRLLR